MPLPEKDWAAVGCYFTFIEAEASFMYELRRVNKLMKKAVILVLLFALLSVPYTPVYASDYDPYADALYSLGLFKGTGTNADGTPIYSLDKNATRVESLVMLIRLLGEENAALSSTASHPFTDVPNGHWSYSYVAYAYSKGYTQGTSSSTFSPNAVASANMYLTYLLRALKYDDSAGDFSYADSINKAVSIGLIPNKSYSDGSAAFKRDDCAYTSFLALGTKMKNDSKTLAENLEGKGVFTKAAYDAVKTSIQDKQTKSYIHYKWGWGTSLDTIRIHEPYGELVENDYPDRRGLYKMYNVSEHYLDYDFSLQYYFDDEDRLVSLSLYRLSMDLHDVNHAEMYLDMVTHFEEEYGKPLATLNAYLGGTFDGLADYQYDIVDRGNDSNYAWEDESHNQLLTNFRLIELENGKYVFINFMFSMDGYGLYLS